MRNPDCFRASLAHNLKISVCSPCPVRYSEPVDLKRWFQVPDGPGETGRPQSLWGRTRDASLIGLLCFVFVGLHFRFLAYSALPDRLAGVVPTESFDQFLLGQFIAVLFLCLVCAGVGVFFSRRYGLGGLGSKQTLRMSLPWLFVFALVGAPVVFFAFDRHFAPIAWIYYPTDPVRAVVAMISNAVTGEIIARFGMMTIIMGVVRNFRAANLLQAMFIAALATRSFSFVGQPFGLNYLSIVGLTLTVAGSLLAGWIYYRFGILSAILGRLLVELRLLAFLWI